MKVTLTEMHSITDAIRTMYMSKRTWTPELEKEIRAVCNLMTSSSGKPLMRIQIPKNYTPEIEQRFLDMIGKLFKYGQKHTTMLRFIALSVIVEGLHRGATDDFDSHAKRLENRIIRSSTRLANYNADDVSDWYKDKIIPLETALLVTSTQLPKTIVKNGETYVRADGGYVKEGFENNKDVLRGLLPLSIPMTFTFKVNLVELAHIYRERGTKEGGAHGTAAPELQEMMEELMNQLESWYPMLTREYLLGICN